MQDRSISLDSAPVKESLQEHKHAHSLFQFGMKTGFVFYDTSVQRASRNFQKHSRDTFPVASTLCREEVNCFTELSHTSLAFEFHQFAFTY